MEDAGSQARCARVKIAGVPVYGIVDSGADITIIGGHRAAANTKLRKRDFKKSDKTPWTYNQQPFALDGRIDLDITFEDRTMKTTIYVKMDAHDQLLLSEGVCRQLGIFSYHPQVEVRRGRRRKGLNNPSSIEPDAASVP